MNTLEQLPQITAKDELTREEIFTYFKSWKQELDALKDPYDKLYHGSMGGIVMIVVTIGLNLDVVSKLAWYDKSILGSALFLLILAAGNILNCTSFVTNCLLELLRIERELILKDYEKLPRKDITDIEVLFSKKRDDANRYYPNSYWCILLATLLGVIGFFIILVR